MGYAGVVTFNGTPGIPFGLAKMLSVESALTEFDQSITHTMTELKPIFV